MAHLQVQGAVTEGVAALDAFAAADTKRFVDCIFVETLPGALLDELPDDGARRAKLVFGPRPRKLPPRQKGGGWGFVMQCNVIRFEL